MFAKTSDKTNTNMSKEKIKRCVNRLLIEFCRKHPDIKGKKRDRVKDIYFYSYKFFYSIHFAYITFFTCFIWWNNIYNWAIKITINTAKRTENKKRICCFFTTQVIFQATNYNWANIENCTKLPYHFENGFQRRSIFYKSMTICQLLCFPLFLKISVTFFKGTILLRMHTTQIMNQRHD